MLLQETADYYKMESSRILMDHPCAAYLEKAHQRLLEEFERNSNYLSPSTEQKLITTFLDVYLSNEQSETLLKMEQSGLVHMIRNNKVKELQVMYGMFTRRNDSFDLLKQ